MRPSSIRDLLVQGMALHLSSQIRSAFVADAAECAETSLQMLNASADVAETVSCSGGSFYIEWGGNITLTSTIIVGDSTTLRIVGVSGDPTGESPVVSGNGTFGLFELEDNAVLYLTGLTLEKGYLEDGDGAAISIPATGTAHVNNCDFIKNVVGSGGEGGAIYSEGVLEVEDSYFFENDADASGGAIYGSKGDSKTTITSTTFDLNKASGTGGNGGAVYVHSEAFLNASFCNFSGNSASVSGGAMYVSGTVHSVAYTTFLVNTAKTFGGGLYVSSSGTVEFLESTNFTKNKASNAGGAVYVSNVLSSVSGCTFTANEATFNGGAIYVSSTSAEQHNITDTSFTRNIAGSSGGGIYSSGAIGSVQNCAFSENLANLKGGGLYLSTSAKALPEVSSCEFTANSAGTQGGALYSSKIIDLVEACNFTGNVAGIDAGAVFLSETLLDDVTSFNSSTFWYNSATTGGGGAVYVVDGNAALDGCSFSYNMAAESGGAIYFTSLEESDAYLLELSDTHFKNNSAANGGAIYSTRNISTSFSTYRGNVAASAGGALFLFGDAIVKNLITDDNGAQVKGFIEQSEGNSAACCHPSSYYLSSGCIDVDGAENSNIDCCGAGYFMDEEEGCVACGSVIDCTEVGVSTTTLPLRSDYWRADFSQTMIRKCLNPHACKGGEALNGSPNDYCSDGYTGAYCAACTDGYGSSYGYACSECGSNTYRGTTVAAIAFVVLIFISAVVLVAIDLYDSGADHADGVMTTAAAFRDTAAGCCGNYGCGMAFLTAYRSIPFSKLRIPVVVFQILVQYVAITGIQYPDVLQKYFAFLSVISLEFAWVLSSISCFIPSYNFFDRLLLVTLTPLLIMGLLAISWALSLRRERQVAKRAIGPRQEAAGASGRPNRNYGQARRARVTRKHAGVFFIISFLIFSSVSNVIFQTFACDNLEEVNQSWLRADYSISCDTETYDFYRAYAIVMTIIYPIGIPICFAWVLWRQRHLHAQRAALAPGYAVDDPDKSMRTTQFLWQPYKAKMYIWEVAECVRRLVLTGILVWILPGQVGQAAVASVLSILSLAAVAYCAPHADWIDGSLYITGAVAISIAALLSLVIQAKSDQEQLLEQQGDTINVVGSDNAYFNESNVLPALIIFLTLLIVAVTLLQLGLSARQGYVSAVEVRNTWQERAGPRASQQQPGPASESDQTRVIGGDSKEERSDGADDEAGTRQRGGTAAPSLRRPLEIEQPEPRW